MDKRKTILEAAEKLFVEKGFEATTVRDLAKEAGVNLAMISYYFGSKEKLLEELVQQKADYSRSYLEDINRQQDLDPFQKLEKAIDATVERIISNRKFHMMLYRELSLEQRQDLHEVIMDIMYKSKTELHKLLNEGVEQKYFPQDADLELLITTMYGVINQCSRDTLVKKLMFKGEEVDYEKLKPRVKNYLKKILTLYLK